MTKAGERILKSIRQARAYARGEATEGFVAHVPEDVDVKAIRLGLGLSQEAFALRFGFSLPPSGIGSSIGGSPSRQPACCCSSSHTTQPR
jgi:hypothetical protein